MYCLHPPFARLVLGGALAAALLSACATARRDTLYVQLGGAARVEAVVSRLIDRAALDPRTQRSFDGVKLATLKESLAQHLCAVADGGCHYEGETMKNAHSDLKIVPSEFDALVTMLREELDRAGVATAAKNQLLQRLAPMKRDVVG